MKALFRYTLKIIQEAFFPSKCLDCKVFFDFQSNEPPLFEKWASKADIPINNKYLDELNGWDPQEVFSSLMVPFLCNSCLSSFLPVESPICTKCGFMFKSREGDDHACQECITSPKSYGIARSAGVYNGSFRNIIHRFKYNGKTQLIKPLGLLLFSAFIRFFSSTDIDIIIPVPLHIKRLKKRGFNQALLLVKVWETIPLASEILEVPWKIKKNVLIREKWTEAQTGLNRQKRMANIKNAFSLHSPSEIVDKRILLVDDVYTTGATVNECAKVLLKGGAKRVDVLTLARTL